MAAGLPSDVCLRLIDRFLVGLRHHADESRLGAADRLFDVTPSIDVERRAIGIRSNQQRVARLAGRELPRHEGLADVVP